MADNYLVHLECKGASSAQADNIAYGRQFDITIVAKDSLLAENNIDSVIKEISRIENLLSDWKINSQVSEVNRNAGIGREGVA